MASPSRRKVPLFENHVVSVEDSPIMGIPNRPLPMGSVFVPRTEVDCRKVATPRRKLSLASKEGINGGEGSKSVEIVEMKTENARTPSRRITRSITIISESKERDSPSVKEVLKSTSHNKKSVKRTSDHVEEDSSIKKNKMAMQSNPEASIPTTQNYSFIIHPENRFGGTINVFYKNDVISVLNAKLNAVQKEMFRSSCFGHFLQMSEMRIQHQIIHKMLMLEIRQPNEDEMWFDLDGKMVRFSIHEFCMVSGLKCAGDESLNLYKIGGCRLRDKYFSNLKNVYRNDVEHVFKELPLDTPDEDVVKIGILYFITMYLFTTTQPNVVNNDVMRLVDSPHMNSFPWGKELFQLTFRNLKNAFKNSESIDGDNKVILTYRLYGFPLAFQIWVYELIPSLSRKFCKRIRYGSPRILNWTNEVPLFENHVVSVEDSPIMGIPNRPLPMGSVFVPRTEVDCRKVATPRRKLSLASKEGINGGEGSKSVEIVEMKTENARTPSRRITRSITIISESKERDSPSVKEVLKSTSHNKKSVKRTSDHVEEDSSIKKNKMAMQSNPEASIPTTQNYSFIIHPENRFGGTINVFYKNDVISVLNAKLNAVQKEMFRSSCFGHFLQMSEMRIQHQIIHKMLMLEIRQPNEDEMWFDLDGKMVRFSIHEFCMVSGLKCAGDESLNLYKIGGCRLRDKYFSNLKNVYRNDVEHVFKELPLDTPDEDVVKIGILYFITMYLFTTTQPNVVNNDVMRLVDSPHMNSFPWGKELFQLTFRNLKNAFKKSESIDGDNKVILTYRLYGFPLAFQIWVYELIPSLSRKFCKRIRYGSPRILNWTNDESRVTAANLDKFLSQLEEVEVVDMQPNDLEKRAAYYIGLGERESITMEQCIPREKHNHATRKNKVKSTVTTSDNAFIPCMNKPTTEATKPSDAHITKLIQQMATQVQRIQSNQIQIIDAQNEIKSSITRIGGELDTKYNALLELVSIQNNDNQGTERSGKSTKRAESLNTKVLAKATQSSTRQKVIFAKGVTGGNELQENVPLIDNSFDKLKHISTDVDNSDEIQFTEEDLIKVDQIVKSVRSKKGKCVDQSGGSSKNSEEIHTKIIGDDEAVMKALFLDEANADNPAAQNHVLLTDAIQSPTAVKHYSTPGYHTNAKYNLFPFSVDMAEPGDEDVAAFESWFGDGYKPGLIKFKFPPSKDVIKPPMQFGPYVIASKTWWHELWEPNVYLRDSHLNICFYYFRKMLRHSSLSTFKCTTTDSYFAPMVRNAFKSCMEDIYSVSKYKSLVEIANGDFIHCNTSWSEVDHVLLPIMMEKKAHWVLGDFNVRERSLTIYNSSRLTIRDRMVSNDMQAFAYVLPCLMVNMNVWEPIVVNGVPCVEPLDVIIATGIPQDDYGHECGLYVIKYAEFIFHQQLETICEKFDPKGSRSQLAVQLYTYACEKLAKGYETDCDLVPRSVRRARKLSSSRNI